jgi:hypothetical protein
MQNITAPKPILRPGPPKIEPTPPKPKILQANREEVLLMMAHAYLNGLKTYLPKKKIQGFDTAKFLHDVESLFAGQGWLQEVEVV